MGQPKLRWRVRRDRCRCDDWISLKGKTVLIIGNWIVEMLSARRLRAHALGRHYDFPRRYDSSLARGDYST